MYLPTQRRLSIGVIGDLRYNFRKNYSLQKVASIPDCFLKEDKKSAIHGVVAIFFGDSCNIQILERW
jgi:hypothetical protein